MDAEHSGRGFFVAIEGCNGAGKSTIAEHLASVLRARRFHFPPDFIRFKEESGLDRRVQAIPRLAYHLAAAVELSDLVQDALADGDVVCDRYFPSALVPAVSFEPVSLRVLFELAEPFLDHIARPDLILLLTVDPPAAIERIRSRAATTGKLTDLSERLISDPGAFVAGLEVLKGQAAALGPVVEIDTTSLTIEDACRTAVESVRAFERADARAARA